MEALRAVVCERTREGRHGKPSPYSKDSDSPLACAVAGTASGPRPGPEPAVEATGPQAALPCAPPWAPATVPAPVLCAPGVMTSVVTCAGERVCVLRRARLAELRCPETWVRSTAPGFTASFQGTWRQDQPPGAHPPAEAPVCSPLPRALPRCPHVSPTTGLRSRRGERLFSAPPRSQSTPGSRQPASWRPRDRSAQRPAREPAGPGRAAGRGGRWGSRAGLSSVWRRGG